ADLPKRVNKYNDGQARWELKRQGREAKLRTVLYNAAEAIRLCGVLISPFLVHTPAGLWRQIGMEPPAQLSWDAAKAWGQLQPGLADRKSTRLNSSHVKISYAVFCLKKK